MASTSGILPIAKEGDNVLYEGLASLGMNEEDIEFILEQRYKLNKNSSKIFKKRLNISLEKATSVIELLESSSQVKSSRISEEEIAKIEECLRDDPEFSEEDIATYCNINTSVVSTYLQGIPLSEKQKDDIKEKVVTGNSICEIASIWGLCPIKVQNYVESTFITFSCDEGERCLDVIRKEFENYPIFDLRRLIVSNDLKLRDELGCILPKRNKDEYSMLNGYFSKFEESKSFFQIDTSFTKSDITLMQQSNLDEVDYLSIKLNKVASVIRDFMEQYSPNTPIIELQSGLQDIQIKQLFADFGEETLTFLSYRMIISNSLDEMIQKAKNKELRNPCDIFYHFLPFAFYYIKCSLPLEDITPVISSQSEISLTTHDLFHLIYQRSDPVLRGFCIEHYSFSNPVPFYYPKLHRSLPTLSNIKFGLCKELWYSLEQYQGLVSFGLGRAGWNPIGKSSLLDLMFETDFVKGNPQNSAFHFNSIDIQMTRNLCGGKTDTSTDESIRWAYLDCNGHSNHDVIKVISQRLDIAIVHVSYHDYENNSILLKQDITDLAKTIRHLYILIRDYRGKEVKVKVDEFPFKKLIFIPRLNKPDANSNSVKKSLKELGYEILHLKPKTIGSDFMENIMKELDTTRFEEITTEKKLILNITDLIRRSRKSSDNIDFSFLNYYPLFVNYMSCYHRASYENRQDEIDKLNKESKRLDEKLNTTQIGSVVNYFNEILNKKSSTLILWKLSQELSLLTRQVVAKNRSDKIVEQKNDRYNLEVIWREALLSYKFGKSEEKGRKDYIRDFASNFGDYVERGEPFELIDGDNLRFLNQEIDELLSDMYNRQFSDLDAINECEKFKMKQAPIVVSIIGPQSSGKSTLLNYCFGCKFLTSAGRCTRGIYASLAKLSRPVNLTNQFLILDTEGLDGIERTNFKDTSQIHFDRTMVLFCLAVSQVVIINVKGDIGSELQNLLEICAYSLNKLKVRKVATPKIFFVLNQQADPDPAKHIDSIKTLLGNLNKESDLLDMEGAKISDLIQVLKENLFVLPSAFNSVEINKPSLKIFNSNVTKLSPTINFANKCTDLLLAIIEQLDSMPLDDRTPFKTMSEWMEMSGTVWDTIIRYQDIVKYRNFAEIMCNNLLMKVVSELMDTNINSHKQEYLEFTEKLFVEIQKIDVYGDSENLLAKFMLNFDNIFEPHQENCFTAFSSRCEREILLKEMKYLCDESRSNLSRLIYMEKKIYEDKIKFQIKSVLAKIKLRESRRKFQEIINQNINNYLELGDEDREKAFQELWIRCFSEDDKIMEDIKLNDCFSDLYSIFKVESKTMEKESIIFQKFRDHNFQMKKVISVIESDIPNKFIKGALMLSSKEQFIFPCNENNIPIKDMTPYPGKQSYSYLAKNSLFVVEVERNHLISSNKLIFKSSVPKECKPLVMYCSGYYNHPDIVWGTLDKKNQILLLLSYLKSPQNPSKSTWEILIKDISSNVKSFLLEDPHVSPATVKKIIYYLCTVITIVNYEIHFIQAKLTNTAERTISTLVFAYAFESFWKSKSNELENTLKTKNEKESLRQYFLQKIANRKMVLEGWDRNIMQESDSKMSRQFASRFLDGVRTEIITLETPKIEEIFNQRSNELSHESVILSANELVQEEVNKNVEVTDENNFVILYVCNRNQKLKEIFFGKWVKAEEEIYKECIETLRQKFSNQIKQLKQILDLLLTDLTNPTNPSGSMKTQQEEDFDSNCNFETADTVPWEVGSEAKMKESPCKAMVMYLRMCLDPSVTLEAFKEFITHVFEVDGVRMKTSITFVLSDKPIQQLNEDTFKKLDDTMMFTSENIFNVLYYIKQFLAVLNTYDFELTLEEFKKILQPLKDKFEKNATGCPNQCPSCGKLCERELHPNDGKCQINTGHQICSMGGKVWNNDYLKTAVLFTCDDYKDHTKVVLEGNLINWSEFKNKYYNEWNWRPHEGKKYVDLRKNNRESMKNIWTLFGEGILNYYAKSGTRIAYLPYTYIEDVYRGLNTEYYICFVIDGTVSMATEIRKTRISVGQFIDKYLERSNYSRYKVVIYRDHCDKYLIENYPIGDSFTVLPKAVQGFLNGVSASGGGDFPEAVLDGLATAGTVPDWKTTANEKNIVIHIFDAPPHGNPPDYTSHDDRSHKKHCCCCNHGSLCKFIWDSDVWGNFKKYKIQYHGINTGKRIPEFESVMKEKLGVLCRDFQNVEDELVNEAILQIFIQTTAD